MRCKECGGIVCTCGTCHACERRKEGEATDAALDAAEKEMMAEATPETTKPESEMVNCRGCNKLIVWTGIYGDWCHTCKPRTLPAPKMRFVQTGGSKRHE